MANYTITLTVEAAKQASVEKVLRKTFGDDVPIHSIEKVKTADSRAARLSEAETMADNARGIVEELKDELESWKDSLPENLQNGDKASQLDDAISNLEELQSNLESLDFGSIEFPGMY
jgi:hypothetical protein